MSYSARTEAQLQVECARRLKTTGSKELLVDRLETFDADTHAVLKAQGRERGGASGAGHAVAMHRQGWVSGGAAHGLVEWSQR